MARRYFAQPPSSIETEEYILAKQLERQNQPTALDKGLAVAASFLNAGLAYKQNRDMLAKKEAMAREEQDALMAARGLRRDPQKGWVRDDELAKMAAGKEWAMKSGVATNPTTGKPELYTFNPDPGATEKYSWTGISPVDNMDASRERMDLQKAQRAADYVYRAVVKYDRLTQKPYIDQNLLAEKIKRETDPLIKYYLNRMRDETYVPTETSEQKDGNFNNPQ